MTQELTQGPPELMAPDFYDPNMPPLTVRRGRNYGPIVPLDSVVQDVITDRAHNILTSPVDNLSDVEMDLLQALKTGCLIKDFKPHDWSNPLKIRGSLYKHLGINKLLDERKQPSAVYKAIMLGIIEPPTWRHTEIKPVIPHNLRLHMYLAVLGFTSSEAAAMTNVRPNTGAKYRKTLHAAIGGFTMAHMTARLFGAGLYTRDGLSLPCQET